MLRHKLSVAGGLFVFCTVILFQNCSPMGANQNLNSRSDAQNVAKPVELSNLVCALKNTFQPVSLIAGIEDQQLFDGIPSFDLQNIEQDISGRMFAYSQNSLSISNFCGKQWATFIRELPFDRIGSMVVLDSGELLFVGHEKNEKEGSLFRTSDLYNWQKTSLVSLGFSGNTQIYYDKGYLIMNSSNNYAYSNDNGNNWINMVDLYNEDGRSFNPSDLKVIDGGILVVPSLYSETHYYIYNFEKTKWITAPGISSLEATLDQKISQIRTGQLVRYENNFLQLLRTRSEVGGYEYRLATVSRDGEIIGHKDLNFSVYPPRDEIFVSRGRIFISTTSQLRFSDDEGETWTDYMGGNYSVLLQKPTGFLGQKLGTLYEIDTTGMEAVTKTLASSKTYSDTFFRSYDSIYIHDGYLRIESDIMGTANGLKWEVPQLGSSGDLRDSDYSGEAERIVVTYDSSSLREFFWYWPEYQGRCRLDYGEGNWKSVAIVEDYVLGTFDNGNLVKKRFDCQGEEILLTVEDGLLENSSHLVKQNHSLVVVVHPTGFSISTDQGATWTPIPSDEIPNMVHKLILTEEAMVILAKEGIFTYDLEGQLVGFSDEITFRGRYISNEVYDKGIAIAHDDRLVIYNPLNNVSKDVTEEIGSYGSDKIQFIKAFQGKLFFTNERFLMHIDENDFLGLF